MKYAIIIMFLFTSCILPKESSEMKEWLPSDSLNVEIGSPTLIKKAGDLLFVNYSFTDGCNIDAVDIANDSILYSFATKGQGADEFLQIASMDVYRLDDKWFLSLFDNMKRECVFGMLKIIDFPRMKSCIYCGRMVVVLWISCIKV